MTNPAFHRYIGIDYSGAETPDSSLKGLRVYEAGRLSVPVEVQPPPSPRKYWTRRGLAQWLAERLSEDVPTIAGIDHAFSFPLRYFEVHHLKPDWPAFLDDFQKHWPTDAEHSCVDFVRDGLLGDGEARSGSARWRRITEERAGAKLVFHFDVPGTVAKSTHAYSLCREIRGRRPAKFREISLKNFADAVCKIKRTIQAELVAVCIFDFYGPIKGKKR